MKKVLKSLFMAFLVITMLALSAMAIDVYIDDVKVKFDSSTGSPFIENGRTLVPLRATMEAFGAEVSWDGDINTAFVKKDVTTVRCVIGQKCIYRNNVRIDNDAAAVIKSGRTYLPIRVVVEAFGATVVWDGNVKVYTNTNNSYIKTIETAKASTTNYWPVWNSAIELKKKGDYKGTLTKILSISSVFIKDNKPDSQAMLFKHVGECHANLGEYAKASACFAREAYYWGKASGQQETQRDAERRSKLIRPYTQIYALAAETYGADINFGVKYEPVGGTYIGAYAESDKNIYNPNNPSSIYFNSFPQLVGADMAAYMLYMPYGKNASFYESHFKVAKQQNKIMQISIEPNEGLDVIKANDAYLIQLAKDFEKTGCKIMIRFAGEMNEVSSAWYTTPAKYIEKFRIFADIFHKYAPSVPIIWAPNFYPADTMDDYYPGDKYVDYVGISSYQGYQTVTDPLGKGVERSKWSNQLDTIYALYSHKKPIIVVEGSAAFKMGSTDLTSYAEKQIKEFYTYLPIKYPNIKMCFMFATNSSNKNYALSENKTILNAFQTGIKSSQYLNTLSEEKNTMRYYELGNNVYVPSSKTTISSYSYTVMDDVSYVKYYVNDESAGVSYGIPYSVAIDFAKYKGKTVKLTCKAFNASHKVVSEAVANVKVK